MARKTRGRVGAFGPDATEGTIVLLWSLTGVAGSVACAAALLLWSSGRGEVWMWLTLLLPGAVIGSGQRTILHERCGVATSVLWLAGSIAGTLAHLVAGLRTDERLALAFVVGVLGMIPGFLQTHDLDCRFVRGSWWMALSGMSYALGCTLAYAIGNWLPWGADAGVLLSFPCVALFTGVSVVFVTRDPVR